MKYWILILASICSGAILAQQNSSGSKGATPLNEANTATAPKNTYAVVVGISDYQDKDIPDLRFADKDAEAFANFLRSPAGGSLDGDHLKVLTNKDATMGQFAAALDWLWEVSKEGDLAIIYFSGHGDVEKKSITQPGYLLCWDAPSRVYMGGGAFALPMFQDVVTTLSAQNKAKVVVITDACRSGKLAGSSVGGTQVTGSNLARQYANEIKILSCQPNEYSIEGEQWGGGRGAFSYNLVNALYGLADGNNDLSVTLQEVGRYLEDHVTAEVAPVSQVPMVLGNRTERLATVDAKLLSALRSGKTSQMQMLSPIETRGMEDEVLASVDTTVRELYRLFKKALKDKVFLVPNAREPAIACADAYYERLIVEPKMQRLHSTMARNYAAALQDDAQQTLNEWLKTGQDASLEAANTARLPQKVFTEKVMTYPRCLDRAAELLGSKHYMYAALKARKYFFEGYLLANTNQSPNQELGERVLDLFRQSLAWQPEQPHVYWRMSWVFWNNILQPDSLEHYAWKAMALHTNWTTPALEAAMILSNKFHLQDRARPFLVQASRIDSNSAVVLNGWANFNFGEKNFEEAEQQLKKAISKDSTFASPWHNLGYMYNITQRYAEAEMCIKKAIELGSTSATTWHNLGYLYSETGRYEEAEQYYKKAIELDSMRVNRVVTWVLLGNMYNKTKRYAEAEPVFLKIIAIDSTYKFAWNSLGHLYFLTQRYAEAESVLKKAIVLDSLFPHAHRHLGMVYFKTNRLEEARRQFLKTIELRPNAQLARLGLAAISYTEGKTAEAIGYVEQAIGKGSTFDDLNKDEDLAALRALPEWNNLMKKYFPHAPSENKAKD
ncbi:MAG: tetratricopeptide repeat protein [Saprospiraceae bacterium]|nr:tetratricopeptide repeat protein [Candidatus Vicinibacter affinis]